MSTAAKANEPASIGQLTTMHAMVAGKVSETRSHEGTIYTTILIPAVDEYTSPNVVEVRSKGRIGQNGEEVRVKVKIGGFLGKPFNSVDHVTGERRQVRQCKIVLDQTD